MTTKIIGVKEFRKNISSYHKKCLKNNWHILVMNRNTPIFEVRPINPKTATLEKLHADIAQARKDYKEGRYYPLEEVLREFRL